MHPTAAGLIIALLVVALVVLVLWAARTTTLTRRVGSFACLVARCEAGPWRAGIAQYGRKRMYWWRRTSLAPRAAAVWQREGFVVLERHGLPQERVRGQRPESVVVHCRIATASGPVEQWLQMAPSAYAGFTGWIEATPTPVGRVF